MAERLVLFSDPIASRALAGLGNYQPGLGYGRGLGLFGIDDALIAAAIPFVQQAIAGANRNSQVQLDPVSAVWKKLPAEAIGAHVGSDGWWLDNATGAKLSQNEAATRQQEITAATIYARVDPGSGWWVDVADGHQLSHAEAWQRYQALANGEPIPRGESTTPATHNTTGTPITFPRQPVGQPNGSIVRQAGPVSIAGVSLTTPVIIGALAVVALLLYTNRKTQ